MQMGGERGWGGFIVVMVGAFVGAFFFGRTTTPAEFEPQIPNAPPKGPALNYDNTLDRGETAQDERVEELRVEIAAYEQLAQAYEEELYGVPLVWPEDVPEVLSPAGFEAQVRKAVEECEAGVELTGFDCSEPPCFALLRVREGDWRTGLVNECAAWNEPYGTTTSGASFSVECADGSEERVEMLGAPVAEALGLDREEQGRNPMKRLTARMKEHQLRWTCAGEEG